MTRPIAHDCYVICPHCGYEHGDAWEWAQNTRAKQYVCNGCEKTFWYWAEHLTNYYSAKEGDVPDWATDR